MTIKEAKQKMRYSPSKGWHIPEERTRNRFFEEGGRNRFFVGTRGEQKEVPFYTKEGFIHWH